MGKAESKLKKKITPKLIFYCAMMVFPVLQFLVFYIGVNSQSFLFAFQEYNQMDGTFEFDNHIFGNFATIWESLTSGTKNLWWALKNSLLVWFFTSFLGTIVAVFFSYYIFKHAKSGRVFRFLLFLPSILPSMLLSIVFLCFVNDVLPIALNIPKLLADGNDKFATILFYTIWIGFGTQVLLYTGSMEQVSTSVIEAGKIDGATPMIELFLIVLPCIMPTIGTFLISGIAGTFINQANLFNFYGHGADPEFQTIGYHLFASVTNPNEVSEVNYPYASALGLCCTVIAVPPTLLLRKVFARFEE